MALNLLPIIIAGGAIAYVVSSGKKKNKVKIIDKGSYRYSADCKHFWVGKTDFATMDLEKMDSVNPTLEQKNAVARFANEALNPALLEVFESHKGDTDWDDEPLFIIKWAIDAVAKLVPECQFTRDHKISKVGALALVMTVSQMPPVIQEIGGDWEEFLKVMVFELIVLSKEMARVGSKKLIDGKVDLLAFIEHVQANPDQYEVSQEEFDKLLSGKGAMGVDFSELL